MTALNFPGSPTIDQVYTANGKTFVWDGASWRNTTSKTFTGLNINGAITERIEVTTNLLNGTTNFNAKSYGVLYNTVTAMENWTLNVRGDESTSLNTMLSVGQSLTAVHIVTMGSTSYSPTLHIDGSVATVNWQTTATLSAYTNCSVIYTFFILKTAANTFTVLGSQSPFIVSNNEGGGELLYVYRAGDSTGAPEVDVPTLTTLTISSDNEQAVSLGSFNQYFVQDDGTMWVWNYDYATPTQVGTDTDWYSVVHDVNLNSVINASPAVLTLKQDGTLWGLGNGAGGIFGEIDADGEGVGPEGAYRNNQSTSLWLDVITFEGVEFDQERFDLGEIFYRTEYYAALDTNNSGVVEFDQELFDLGAISLYGQFANSPATDITEFVQIGTDDDWATIYLAPKILVAAAAIKNDGTLWALWGNTITQVGSDTDWAKIVGNLNTEVTDPGVSNWFALKTNGTLWNASFDISLGDDYFTQVGSDTNWVDMSASRELTSIDGTLNQDAVLFLKSNGTMWGLGHNFLGRLGNGLTTGFVALSSSPVQIGSDTDWAKIGAGFRNSAAVKTNGTLWTTGANANSQLGLGDNDINPGFWETVPYSLVDLRSTWTQVGSRTDWVFAEMHTLSIFLSTSDS